MKVFERLHIKYSPYLASLSVYQRAHAQSVQAVHFPFIGMIVSRRQAHISVCKIATWFQPAGRVSGDYYDVFVLLGGYMGLVIGDLCDKG